MTDAPQPAGAAEPAERKDANEAPDAERIVSDPETLKALSDPLRLRIMEAMVGRTDEPWSAKELAARLDVPQTRLYHHIELLVERDLLRIANQRVVSGIIETRYRVAALAFRLDHRLLSGDDQRRDAGREVLHAVFDASREDVGRALDRHLSEWTARRDASAAAGGAAAGDPGTAETDPSRPILSRGLARLTPERATEFRERLLSLVKEFESDTETATAATWGLLVAFYRQEAGTSKEASHD